MRKAVVCFLVLASVVATAEAGQLNSGENPVKDRYIVVLKSGIAQRPEMPPAPGLSVREVVQAMVLLHGGRVEKTFEHALQGSLLTMTEAQAKALAQDPRVAYVDQDRVLPLSTDQVLFMQWGLNRVDERDLPLNNHFTYTTTGAGVNAYILDSGIDGSDLEFGSRVVNAYTAIQDESGNPLHGDCNGHGTKVAKVLGGSVSGVAKQVTLNSVRVGTVCNCTPETGGGPTDPPLVSTGSCEGVLLSDALAGINWVTANRVKPAVANMSFSGGATQSLDNAVQGMINAGVVAVTAAGNSGVSACGISPARVAGALTVGASDRNDARSVWSGTQSSNFGSCVDLFAPGTDLDLWNATSTFSGTSAASPLVAGAVARYLQSTPAATPSQAHSYIINNATTGRLTGIGTGSPNRLLFSPPGGPEIDNPPVANFNFSCSGRTCTLTSTSTDDFLQISSCSWDFGHPYDFQPRTSCSLSHTFPAAGSYSVTLYVSDDAWQNGQKVRVVTVN